MKTSYTNMSRGEVAMVKATVEAMEARGYELSHAYDGEATIRTTTIDALLDVINSVEESSFVMVLKGASCQHRAAFWIVLGNDDSGEEVIANHSDVAAAEEAWSEAQAALFSGALS